LARKKHAACWFRGVVICPRIVRWWVKDETTLLTSSSGLREESCDELVDEELFREWEIRELEAAVG
jgi:hypothetical protein